MALGWAQRTQKAWVETLTLTEILPASEEQAAAVLALGVRPLQAPEQGAKCPQYKPETIWMRNTSPELLRGLWLSQES